MRSLSSTEGVGPGESAGALAFEEHDVLVERVVIVVSSDIAMRDKDETDEGRKRRRKRQARMMQEENLEEEPDEEEEPIFVLTDEWRDFFAKSEAKRREGN
nr:uncharacterized histidine-rich protein DDB_G0274557-like [Ipomoea batatas]